MGADSMSGVLKPGKQKQTKMVNAPQPSYEDYMRGLGAAIMGTAPNPKQAYENYYKGNVLGGSGQFYYGKAPEKVPQGSLVLRGPDVQYQGYSKVGGGSFNASMPTYQVIQAAALAPQGAADGRQKPAIDLSRGGKANVLNRADIKYAMEQGATRKEIRQTAEAQGIRMSAKAKARLYKEKKEKGAQG